MEFTKPNMLLKIHRNSQWNEGEFILQFFIKSIKKTLNLKDCGNIEKTLGEIRIVSLKKSTNLKGMDIVFAISCYFSN